jgi:cytochrome P450
MPSQTRPILEGFDPFAQEYLRDPLPTWERARRDAPVFYFEPLNCWFLSRYEDVDRALTDWQTFSSTGIGLVPVPAELRERIPESFFSEPFIGIDPPQHTVSRKAANKGFTRGRVAALESSITALAHDLIDGFATTGRCDLMHDYCMPLALRTIARLLGVPESDAPRLQEWALALQTQLAPKGIDIPATPDRLQRWRSLAEACEYFRAEVDKRMAQPADDVISTLVHAKTETGEPALSPERVVTHPFELIAAGSDTTASLIAHMVLSLIRDPEALQQLRDDPALWPNAIEEGLRLRGSSWGVFRVAMSDVEMSGTTIAAGSLVYVTFLSASNDERVFADPSRFDIHRANASEHVALGKGRHFCLGAPLARLEARIGLEVLFDRLGDLYVDADEPIRYHPSLVVPMMDRLDVSWTPPG